MSVKTHQAIRNFCFSSLFVTVLAAFSLGAIGKASGQEFKIESQVYSGDSTMPVSQSVTMFSQGIVYEFKLSNESLSEAKEIIIFDSRQRRVALIDPAKSIKLEMLDLRVMKILEGVRRSTEQDKRTQFLVQDSFTEEVDLTSGWVTLSSPNITYRFKGKQPNTVSIVPTYLAYLDNATRLVATDPHQIPPFAKMRLNQSIRQRGWIPSEIQVSIEPNSLFKQGLNAKVKHVLTTGLSKKDRDRITTAKSHWLQFEPVKLSDYRGFQPTKDSILAKIKPAKRDTLKSDIEKMNQSVAEMKKKKTIADAQVQPTSFEKKLDPAEEKEAPEQNSMLEPISDKKK